MRDERRALAAGVLGQETVGAGGIAYALRTLPVALQAAKVIADLAPDAWLINFTNPAGMVTEALHGVAREPGDRDLRFADRVGPACPTGGGPAGRRGSRRGRRHQERQNRTDGIDYVGINHLGWLRSLRSDGRDLLPGLLADDAALASFEEGRLFGGTLLRALGCATQRVRLLLLRCSRYRP